VVMYRGRVVESGPADLVRARPLHHYTKALHDAVPVDHPAQRRLARLPGGGGGLLAGDPAAPGRAQAADPAASRAARTLAGGCCVFADRCPAVRERCRTERPPVITGPDGRSHACFFPLEVSS
jgi:oligopeptide/dipeptide ABC transporter ATP-binding protein